MVVLIIIHGVGGPRIFAKRTYDWLKFFYIKIRILHCFDSLVVSLDSRDEDTISTFHLSCIANISFHFLRILLTILIHCKLLSTAAAEACLAIYGKPPLPRLLWSAVPPEKWRDLNSLDHHFSFLIINAVQISLQFIFDCAVPDPFLNFLSKIHFNVVIVLHSHWLKVSIIKWLSLRVAVLMDKDCWRNPPSVHSSTFSLVFPLPVACPCPSS